MSEWGESLELARVAGIEPRVHGNGFIQLDINERQRLHFWGHPKIPRQSVPSPIHNHVFDFTSQICKGTLTNVEYREIWSPGGLYGCWQAYARNGADTGLQDTGRRCNLQVSNIKILEQGDGYFAHGPTFHETLVHEPSITLLTKQGPTLQQNPNGPRPSVLVAGYYEPDNAFDRHGFHPGMLWDIINDIEGRA